MSLMIAYIRAFAVCLPATAFCVRLAYVADRVFFRKCSICLKLSFAFGWLMSLLIAYICEFAVWSATDLHIRLAPVIADRVYLRIHSLLVCDRLLDTAGSCR